MKQIKQILMGGAKYTPKTLRKKKWLLLIAGLVGGLATNINAAIPTGTFPVTAGDALVTVTSSPFTVSSDAITFTATPSSSITGATGVAYNAKDYEFRFTYYGQNTPGPLPTGATYTTQPEGSAWEHVITFDANFDNTNITTLAIYYVRKVNVTVSTGNGVTNATPALTWTAVGSATSGGEVKFSVTPSILAGDFAKYGYKWKFTVTGTNYSSGVTFSPAGGNELTAVQETEITATLDYTTLRPTNGANLVGAIGILVEVEESPITVTLTEESSSASAFALDPTSGWEATQGTVTFKVTPETAPTTPGAGQTQEEADAREIKVIVSSAALPLYASAAAAASETGAYVLYSWNAGTGSGGWYDVTINNVPKAGLTGEVQYANKPTLTLGIAAAPNLVTASTGVSPATANPATRGVATFTVTTTSNPANAEWIVKNSTTVIEQNAATGLTYSVVSAGTNTFTVTFKNVTTTIASNLTIAYVATNNATLVPGKFNDGTGNYAGQFKDDNSVSIPNTTQTYVAGEQFTINNVKIEGFITDNAGNIDPAGTGYAWTVQFYNGAPATDGSNKIGTAATPTTAAGTVTGTHNLTVTAPSTGLTAGNTLYAVVNYGLTTNYTAVDVNVARATTTVPFNITAAKGYVVATTGAGAYKTKVTVPGITGFNASNYEFKLYKEVGATTGFPGSVDGTTAYATIIAATDPDDIDNDYDLTLTLPTSYDGGAVSIYGKLTELYSVKARKGDGVKNVSAPEGNSTTAGQYTFDVTIDDELAAPTATEPAAVLGVLDFFVVEGDRVTNTEYTPVNDPVITAAYKEGTDKRTITVTVKYTSAITPVNLSVVYDANPLAKTATFRVDKLTGAHLIDIPNNAGNIVDGKFTFIVIPTVPRVLGGDATTTNPGAAGTITPTSTTPTPGDYNGTKFTTNVNTLVTEGLEVYISAPNQEGVDTFIVSNVTQSNLKVEVNYTAPQISWSAGIAERSSTLLENLTPASSNGTPLSDGKGEFSFEVTLKGRAAAAVNPLGTFSYLFEEPESTEHTTPRVKISGPKATEKATTTADVYEVTITGVKRTGFNVTVGYDTIVPKTPDPQPEKPYAVVDDGAVEKALEEANEGELIAIKKTSPALDATTGELETFQNKGTLVPGERLATTLTVSDPQVMGNEPQTVVLSFSGALSSLPPITVENVWIEGPSFKIVYVFDSSTNTLRNAVRTRGLEESWAEYNSVSKTLYIHLVDVDVADLGADPSYAQLAIKDTETGKVGAIIADSPTGLTLYDHPVELNPDNGVPGTNYPGYFTLSGTYPTDGQLRYKVGNDAAYKPYVDGITYQEIERLAQGELLYFGLAAYTDADDAGVPSALFIYVPKTYATTGDNPVVVPRPYAIVAATTNTVALGFSRTAGTTTTGEFTFKVTPAQILPNGELAATFTKKGGGTVNPLPIFDPGKPDIDGAYNAKVTNIKVSDIVITVEYRQGVAVEKVATSKVWSYGNTLFISANNTGVAKIYNLTGQLVKTVNVNTGITITELHKGLYVVTLNNVNTKVTVK